MDHRSPIIKKIIVDCTAPRLFILLVVLKEFEIWVFLGRHMRKRIKLANVYCSTSLCPYISILKIRFVIEGLPLPLLKLKTARVFKVLLHIAMLFIWPFIRSFSNPLHVPWGFCCTSQRCLYGLSSDIFEAGAHAFKLLLHIACVYNTSRLIFLKVMCVSLIFCCISHSLFCIWYFGDFYTCYESFVAYRTVVYAVVLSFVWSFEST